MTVESATVSNSYTGNGTTKDFSYTFRVFKSTDIVVTHDGVTVSSANYTVTGVGSVSGGLVQHLAAPASAVKIVVKRVLPRTQLVDLVVNAAEPSESVEEIGDRAMMLLQEVEALITTKVLKLADNSALSGITFPDPGASKFIRWNAAGTALEVVSAIPAGSVAFSAFGESLVDDADATAARTTLKALGQATAEIYAADAGVSDAYAITLSPAPVAYATGMLILFKANTANTGAATLNVNALGAKALKKKGATDLGDNDISAGQIVAVVYDGTNFQIISIFSTDADTLDTLNSTAFMRSDQNTSTTGNITLNNNKTLEGKEVGGTARVLVAIDGGNIVTVGDVANALNIRSNGTTQINSNTIWHAGNDGAGSGLDADLLDGLSSASFPRNDQATTQAFLGGIQLENQKTLDAKEVGGTARVLAAIDGGNNITFGSTTNALRLRSNGTETLNSIPIPRLGARGKITGATGAVADSVNISSVVKNADGDYTINFSTSFGNADYTIAVMCDEGSPAEAVFGNVKNATWLAGSVRILIKNISAVLQPRNFSFLAIGTIGT